MTFSCKNFDFTSENYCIKLKSECIPGRPGCLLEGRVAFSEEIEKKLKELENKSRKKEKNAGAIHFVLDKNPKRSMDN